jgi:hypothetical protein
MLIILSKLLRIFLIIWWIYSIKGLYKHFVRLSGNAKDMVAVGITAEVILLIINIIKVITI